MNLYHALLASLTCLVLTSTPLFAIEKPPMQKIDGKIDWVYSYEEGKRLSKASGKPMFVVFRCER